MSYYPNDDNDGYADYANYTDDDNYADYDKYADGDNDKVIMVKIFS